MIAAFLKFCQLAILSGGALCAVAILSVSNQHFGRVNGANASLVQPIFQLAPSQDGSVILTLGPLGIVHVHRQSQDHFNDYWGIDACRTLWIEHSPINENVFHCRDDGEMSLYFSNGESVPLLADNLHGRLESAAYSPDGTLIAAAHGARLEPNSSLWKYVFTVWDAETASVVSQFTKTAEQIKHLALSAEPQRILYACKNVIGVARISDGRTIREIRHAGSDITSLVLAPCGNHLAAGDLQGAVTVYNISSGEIIWQANSELQFCISAMAFCPDGSKLVVGASGPTIKMLDAASGQELLKSLPLEAHVTTSEFRFVQDGQQIISSGYDGAVRFWDATTLRQIGLIPPRPI